MWAFHGLKDNAVDPQQSQKMVNRLYACGGDVVFTLYPDAEHDSWTRTYENAALYEWFLAHRRRPPMQPSFWIDQVSLSPEVGVEGRSTTVAVVASTVPSPPGSTGVIQRLSARFLDPSSRGRHRHCITVWAGNPFS